MQSTRPLPTNLRRLCTRPTTRTGKTGWRHYCSKTSTSQTSILLVNLQITLALISPPYAPTTSNGLPDLAEDNAAKVAVLTESFFPPPPVVSHVLPNQIYPTPLCGPQFFSKTRIQQVVQTSAHIRHQAWTRFLM